MTTGKGDGFELWRGPSAIDGRMIGVVVTHIHANPMNRKIGSMSQVWIFPLETAPNDAIRNGDDVSVCGDCRFRPSLGGGCYVPVWSTSHRVWWAWQRFGSYVPGRSMHPNGTISRVPAVHRRALAGKPCRIGAWGDPAAVPVEVWEDLLVVVGQWTAYTERWREVPSKGWSDWCMASCKTPEERFEAHRLGWRTFRVRAEGEAILQGERTCPAADESRSHGKATCAVCHLCDGVRARPVADVVIIAHGQAVVKATRAVSPSSAAAFDLRMAKRVDCHKCGHTVSLRANGKMRRHGKQRDGRNCLGSGTRPIPAQDSLASGHVGAV